MIPCKFVALDGSTKILDLDSVFDVILGYSGSRPDWTATIIYEPVVGCFVELRSSPPDYRGNSAEEAEEVSDKYMRDMFDLGDDQLEAVRRDPSHWKLITKVAR